VVAGRLLGEAEERFALLVVEAAQTAIDALWQTDAVAA
jgi:hypothetical protein